MVNTDEYRIKLNDFNMKGTKLSSFISPHSFYYLSAITVVVFFSSPYKLFRKFSSYYISEVIKFVFINDITKHNILVQVI